MIVKITHKYLNVDSFVSKIEKLVYDEPIIMWAHGYWCTPKLLKRPKGGS
jgi:hypothetical protein